VIDLRVFEALPRESWRFKLFFQIDIAGRLSDNGRIILRAIVKLGLTSIMLTAICLAAIGAGPTTRPSTGSSVARPLWIHVFYARYAQFRQSSKPDTYKWEPLDEEMDLQGYDEIRTGPKGCVLFVSEDGRFYFVDRLTTVILTRDMNLPDYKIIKPAQILQVRGDRVSLFDPHN
jgi:hypothetical protein